MNTIPEETALQYIKTNMDLKARTTLFELALRGYTVRRIRTQMVAAGYRAFLNVPDHQLINLLRDIEPELAEARQGMDTFTEKHTGLVNKWERIQRLAEYAERIEDKIEEDVRWASEYRRSLDQIKNEVEPLGLVVHVGDSWGKLLHKIAEVAQERLQQAEFTPEETYQRKISRELLAFPPQEEAVESEESGPEENKAARLTSPTSRIVEAKIREIDLEA